MVRARDVLGEGSILARSLPGYQARPAQLAMADAVEEALLEEKPLFVEAGTGTGKTLAYLVPALLSGKKVVVSTATRALQEQIFVKDLPLVERALRAHGVSFRATMMKGLTNYLCKRRFAELGTGKNLDLGFGRSDAWSDAGAAEIAAWAKSTVRGDRAELATLPEDASAWLDVQSSSETRIGTPCPFFDACFVTAMRREAELAGLVVVNHHLFFADLALRTGRRGEHAGAIPSYDAVIFDEAHQIEDIATEFFGVRLSIARIEALARDADRTLGASGARGSPFEQAVAAARSFFQGLARTRTSEGRRLLTPQDWTPDAREGAAQLDAALVSLAAQAEARGEGRESAMHVARRAREARADLADVVGGLRDAVAEDGSEPGARVAWIHTGARTVSVGASPVSLGEVLRTSLFDRGPVVICTSATLATATSQGPSCHFVKARLGAAQEAAELVLPSPFDFASRSALYLPRDLPEPGDAAFETAAAQRIAELVKVTGGGAFVLCTSNRAMREIHALLRARLSRAPLLQGEAPKQALLDRFKRDGDAVLVATMSFWEGVDVPGRALRLVVIDKIPFAVPTDPVVMARCAAVDRNGGNSFAEYSVPAAAIMLKQGMGRLLRTEADRGIVAILDRRLTTRGYGRRLLQSLPPARRVTSLDELSAFWQDVTP
jgi:ATP-dependent DNA helicase DinG